MRCSLCGQFVTEVDREALLEEHRLEWSEDLVDEFRLDSHVCADADPYGARAWARLADSGMLRPSLAELVSLALERRRVVGRPRWVVFTSTTTTMALESHQVECRGALALDRPRTRVLTSTEHRCHPARGP
jgi:hypothetical protein